MRGLRTLFARIERQQESAARIAERLSTLSGVAAVHYPGLATHPDHALARRQQKGFGAMLSFELAAGVHPAEVTRRLSRFTLAESLGGIESLIAHPATMTHASMNPEARLNAGITDRLLRVSVGLEHPEDLLADLEAALTQARREAA